eukprot:849785-Amphidinium_carterae.1
MAMEYRVSTSHQHTLGSQSAGLAALEVGWLSGGVDHFASAPPYHAWTSETGLDEYRHQHQGEHLKESVCQTCENHVNVSLSLHDHHYVRAFGEGRWGPGTLLAALQERIVHLTRML